MLAMKIFVKNYTIFLLIQFKQFLKGGLLFIVLILNFFPSDLVIAYFFKSLLTKS